MCSLDVTQKHGLIWSNRIPSGEPGYMVQLKQLWGKKLKEKNQLWAGGLEIWLLDAVLLSWSWGSSCRLHGPQFLPHNLKV